LNRSTLAVAALLACRRVHADYDAKMEAQEAAQAQGAGCRPRPGARPDAQKQYDAAQMKGMRGALGKEADGKSDAEVKKLYDAKMTGYQDQAKKAKAGIAPAGVPQTDMDKANMQMKSMTGKSMQDMQKMTPAEQEAFSRQMEKQYGGAK
jgi:hypothetical protein